jgi:hypothetical protein
MGPTLLLDKSAFQALSQGEMLKISKYFHLNLVDILLWEIMGDFLKQTKTTSSRNEASILADKVSLIDANQNVNYIHLLVENLLGSYVTMDGRPIVTPDTITQLANGQTGAFIDYTRFCDMIHRWQQDNFTKEDIAIANIWQDVKTDCKAKANNYLHLLTANHIVFPKCTDINDMKLEVDKLLRNPNIQLTFLDMLLSYQGVDSRRKHLIKKRIKQHPYPLQKAAPYAFYCMRVFAFFLGSCKHDLLVEKKPDDRIDLEYLFYLPFCEVFSSNDNFHKTLVPQLITDAQVFVSGSELKKGILDIDIPPIQKETMNSKCVPIPPMAKHSLIRDIWISTKWLYN